ncbi:MAG: hypothetical protein ACTHU0_29025, partial [Kofleriaceae bacterium]
DLEPFEHGDAGHPHVWKRRDDSRFQCTCGLFHPSDLLVADAKFLADLAALGGDIGPWVRDLWPRSDRIAAERRRQIDASHQALDSIEESDLDGE